MTFSFCTLVFPLSKVQDCGPQLAACPGTLRAMSSGSRLVLVTPSWTGPGQASQYYCPSFPNLQCPHLPLVEYPVCGNPMLGTTWSLWHLDECPQHTEPTAPH